MPPPAGTYDGENRNHWRSSSRRYFDLLGTPSEHKRQVVAIGGHFIPRPLVIRETLDWAVPR